MDDTSLQHCVEVWDNANTVVAWGGGSLVQKGGPEGVCITLLIFSGKVYSKVLEKRVQLIVEQCRFCPGCGTTDQFFTLIGILEGAWEFAHQYTCAL